MLETNNNLVVLSRLFPQLVGGEPVAKRMILWLVAPPSFTDF